MKSYVFYFCVAAIVAAATATDFCQRSCTKDYRTVTNIGCNNALVPSPACDKETTPVYFNAEQINAILTEHNTYRHNTAGLSKKFRPACRMATMKWDDELAYLAALHALQCIKEHDQCHATDAFHFSGQNIYVYWNTVEFNFASEFIEKAVWKWYKEANLTNQGHIDSITEENIKGVEHFTLMVAEKNTHVGCAAVITKLLHENVKKPHLILVCNYATNNILDSPVYESCSRPGEKCQRLNKIYPSLCSPDEKYDVNNIGFSHENIRKIKQFF